ncbi:helix-turn-helix domain-containing protein [Brevibacillus sp. TJ4]|uniref:helix-turn-helix domain-containing protein n=1 Tax=Brevibacillus sp. TJ4 TaxID=3234853 RepID=UPI003BA25146
MQRVNLSFIAKRRVECGYTQQEMAELLGFKNASTYLKYERGEYGFKAEHMPVLAQKLGVELRDLFYGLIC